MRLIDAEELLEHLEACSQNGRSLSNLYDLSEIVRYVKSMPAVAVSPWHRVELEEPTKAGWYLVMDEDGDFNVDEWHNTFGWQFVTPSDADRITHWMPIEPPKEDA